MPEVAQPVVDRRRREHEERLRPHRVVEQVVELVVARRLVLVRPRRARPGIAEVVGLVDDHDVGELGDPPEPLREVALAAEVGVAEDGEVAEVGAAADAADVRQPLAQVRLPDALLRRLRSEQHDALALVQDEALDQHQPDEGLAETDAVAEECAAVLARDLHQRPVGLLLVAVELREHLRAGLVPLGRGQLVAAEELLQRLRVDVERRVEARVALDGLDDRVGDVRRLVPVRLEPLLELGDLARALDLDVQFDVLGQAWAREVARADERLRADHFELRVRDVRLGVELVLVVDAALDLAATAAPRRSPARR